MNITDEGADRFNEGKPQWSLMDFKAMEPMIRVLEYGTKKYARDNWKKGLSVSSLVDCMMRHVAAMNAGEMIDKESKLPHIGHIQCNAMFIAYMLQKRPELNDLATPTMSPTDESIIFGVQQGTTTMKEAMKYYEGTDPIKTSTS